MEEQGRIKEENCAINEISETFAKFNRELVARYGSLPEHSVVDCKQVVDERDRAFRILSVVEPVLGQNEEQVVVKRTKSNCNKCFGFGYQSALAPLHPEHRGQLILSLCSCLRTLKEDAEND